MALILVAEILLPQSLWSPHVNSQPRRDNTRDLPGMWHTSPMASLRQLQEADRQSLVSDRNGPTPEEHPRYRLKPSWIQLELELEQCDVSVAFNLVKK